MVKVLWLLEIMQSFGGGEVCLFSDVTWTGWYHMAHDSLRHIFLFFFFLCFAFGAASFGPFGV